MQQGSEGKPKHTAPCSMCDAAVREDSLSLQYVPDWFVTQQQVKIWHDDKDDDDELIEWYNAYKKLKAQKQKKT